MLFKSSLLVTFLVGLVLEGSLGIPCQSHSAASHANTVACKKDKQAVIGLLTTEGYVDGARVLGYSLRQHQNIPDDVDLILMYTPERMSPKSLCQLQNSDWTLMPIEPIIAPTGPGNRTAGRYFEQFTKLLVWNMTDYDSVLYIDIDMLVTGPLHHLLNLNIDFAAVLDVGLVNDKTVSGVTSSSAATITPEKPRLLMTFNGGLMYVRPNATLFKVLMEDHRNTSNYAIEYAEQSYLNYFMKYRFYTLPYQYNTQLALKDYPDVWNVVYPQTKIIHYTATKPFNRTRNEVAADETFADVLTRWHDVYEEMLAYETERGLVCK